MYKKRANIIFIAILALSVIIALLVLKIIPIKENLVADAVLIYVFLCIVAVFSLYKFIDILQNKKPKEEVKIIYKSFEKQKAGEDIIERKTSDKIQKYTENITSGIDNLDSHEKVSELLLQNFAKSFNIVQGIVYILNKESNHFEVSNTYAVYQTETYQSFQEGEGITGQVAKNRKFLYIDNVPENYITVLSGLGQGSPKFLAFLPIVSNNKTIAIIEISTFEPLPNPTEQIINSITEKLTIIFEKFV